MGMRVTLTVKTECIQWFSKNVKIQNRMKIVDVYGSLVFFACIAFYQLWLTLTCIYRISIGCMMYVSMSMCVTPTVRTFRVRIFLCVLKWNRKKATRVWWGKRETEHNMDRMCTFLLPFEFSMKSIVANEHFSPACLFVHASIVNIER